MNHPPRAKVLELYLGGIPQGTINLYVNGGIKVSKVKLSESFLKQVNGSGTMMVPGATYGFDYQSYIQTLKNSVGKSFPNKEIQIREKRLGEKLEKLLQRQYQTKYGSRISP
jgi:hypothetical protein